MCSVGSSGKPSSHYGYWEKPPSGTPCGVWTLLSAAPFLCVVLAHCPSLSLSAPHPHHFPSECEKNTSEINPTISEIEKTTSEINPTTSEVVTLHHLTSSRTRARITRAHYNNPMFFAFTAFTTHRKTPHNDLICLYNLCFSPLYLHSFPSPLPSPLFP